MSKNNFVEVTIDPPVFTETVIIPGKQGIPGAKGDKGDTPVKGTDYWTAADKAEIVDDVLAALPTWTGGSY